jgi:hypothetical protein
VDLTNNSSQLGSLATTIPFVAEDLSANLRHSNIPVMARGAIEMINELLQVLRRPGLQKAVGVMETDADRGLIMTLEKLARQGHLTMNTVNAFRLSVIAERLVRAIGACPAPVSRDYLLVFGQLATQYQVMYNMTVGEEVQSGQNPSGFRTERSVAANPHYPTQQPTTIGPAPVTKRWGFRLDLSIELRRS